MKANINILGVFEMYQDSFFSIENDLRFWRSFMRTAIEAYQVQDTREMYSSIFTAYDYKLDGNPAFLKAYRKTFHIKTNELNHKRVEFFKWIMNLSILKIYNSMEILLLQSIQLAYYPDLNNPLFSKKDTNALIRKIKSHLESNNIKSNTKNNDYLIKFLKQKSKRINIFLNNNMNTDLITTWSDFFNFISILRNVIVHHGMIIQNETQNEIKSKAKDVFERYFNLVYASNRSLILTPKEQEFNNLIAYVNSLALNLFKFIFNKKDMQFIGMN